MSREVVMVALTTAGLIVLGSWLIIFILEKNLRKYLGKKFPRRGMGWLCRSIITILVTAILVPLTPPAPGQNISLLNALPVVLGLAVLSLLGGVLYYFPKKPTLMKNFEMYLIFIFITVIFSIGVGFILNFLRFGPL